MPDRRTRPAPRHDPRSRSRGGPRTRRRCDHDRPSTVDDEHPRRSARPYHRAARGAHMSGVLDEVLAVYGGLERWRAVTALTPHGRFRGLLRSRFPGNRMANVTVRVELAEQQAVFHGLPHEDEQAVFDRGDVRIETRDGELINARRDARAAFTGL